MTWPNPGCYYEVSYAPIEYETGYLISLIGKVLCHYVDGVKFRNPASLVLVRSLTPNSHRNGASVDLGLRTSMHLNALCQLTLTQVNMKAIVLRRRKGLAGMTIELRETSYPDP